ncbi:aspartate kinase [Desulfallas thermosapovorans]|uniref:Aspartokinase n=1 Tax=Desulfallas thermosapovorans DSM 6562 TaxID=1121431 RepID=A0A5S4ZYQ6_9FIRM|nr:aspartate kinase [Desulfallas thermosapovorans]TYO97869.1 aspartate kinase [Desulfallas thermosapovorans DSM 6562]
MNFLVLKFGGTSLVTPELRERVASKIIAAKNEGYVPVVVVSAIGRQGDPYATDTLINLVKQANREPSEREMDMLMSCGEIISGVVMTATLQTMGCPAVFLTGAQAGIVTDNKYSQARILKVQPNNIIKYAKEGYVVVVAGFQGVAEGGETTTLGRGGSDTTAAALGVALNAAYVDIYTDVEGIMTADPRIVTEAKALETITYDEICHLAHEGAKVIHPRAVEIAMQKGIPLRVRPTFSDGPGTLVTSLGEVYKGSIDITRDRIITGITYISGIAQIKVNSGADGFQQQRRMFRALALAGVSIDFINILPESVLFTVQDEIAEKAVKVLENAGYAPEVITGCAKVSAVGAGMSGVPGVIADIVEAITKNGIQILQCNDSHTTVWVLVRREDMESAVRALHRQFKLAH